MFWTPGAELPTETAKFKLEDDSEIAGGWTTMPAITFIASDPLADVTAIVTIPTPKLAGKVPVMVLSLHDST
jgi:hypothetical protein